MTQDVAYLASQSAKVDALVAQLAPDMKPIVEGIEDGPKTTQDHYGSYMNIIMVLGKDDRSMRRLIGLALIEAGANTKGVDSAIKALGDA